MEGGSGREGCEESGKQGRELICRPVRMFSSLIRFNVISHHPRSTSLGEIPFVEIFFVR